MIRADIITGTRGRIVSIGLRLNILRLALGAYRNPVISVKVLKSLIRKKQLLLGKIKSPKFIKSGGRYFWSLSSVSWPSPAFNRFILSEMNKIRQFHTKGNNLQAMIFSITSRCPLKCDHCYEWNNLSAEETLSFENLECILQKFLKYGVCNIQFSGGEPLSRFEDLLKLIKTAAKDTDVWILTSRYQLDRGKALQLKQAGLTGVIISLDHWDKDTHNRFRNNDDSYYWAMEAAKNAFETELAVAFSLCATREFVSMENLEKYIYLAKDSGAGMIRILEPREVGHYSGQNIELSDEQIEVLGNFYTKSISDPKYVKLPVVEYTGKNQRINGCFGAGDRYLYVDSHGDVHACPFCQNPVGNAVSDELSEVIPRLKAIGCHKFRTRIPEPDMVKF